MTRAFVEQGNRIEFIRHNSDDSWQAQGAGNNSVDSHSAGSHSANNEIVMVPMSRLVARDASLVEVARMPAGWEARRCEGGDWIVTPAADYAFACVPARGLLVRPDTPSEFAHQFCGKHEIRGAACPNCKKPLLRQLTLDTRDPRLECAELGVPFVHLLFCWTCILAQGRTAYQLLPDGGVQLIRHRSGEPEASIPYQGYPDAFVGGPCELTPLLEAEQAVLDALNAKQVSVPSLPKGQWHLGVPRHQVGGRPRFLQGAPVALCPRCALPLAFLASCGDNTCDGRGFTGNAFMQTIFMVCVADRIIVSLQQGD